MLCFTDPDKDLAVLMKGKERGCQEAEPTPEPPGSNLLWGSCSPPWSLKFSMCEAEG